ncbi:MAG: 1-deoxy-D-xylulose-5-phosphate reductoisomerase [Oscillospiraceae bacterium]|nr:1-deoxy-D-xylulose-5-phosphate reductoisomerase [Oscillospiraceae bacterium]MBP5240031.1 1-deoxy-D-xylulose-5-phosphate reductoisomerase [Oscillospiraceae bacterium]
MVHSISILGCTGSIGRQTAAVADYTGIRVAALTANRQIDRLEEQARKFHPEFVAVYDESAAGKLKTALADTDIRVGSGMDGLIEAATLSSVDCVVTAVSGAVGLKPTLAAIDARKRIALANKETLVCAGELVMQKASETGAEIIPVDSEHSAIFQCMTGRGPEELRKILLTCSGGPFRGKKRSDLESITPAEAVKHPKWNMGAKISVDSATLMNKGLEFIEAMRLFRVTPDDIQVVIHPQSVIHSMVELVDGTVIAQMGVPDMGLPIQLALTWPQRMPSMFSRLDFTAMQDLTFEAPDLEEFPCLRLAMDCARSGGTAGCVMSAANEEAVHLFLKEKIGFNRIYDLAAGAVSEVAGNDAASLETILLADEAARRYVHRVTGE